MKSKYGKIIAVPLYGVVLHDCEMIEVNERITIINSDQIKEFMCNNLDKSIHDKVLSLPEPDYGGFNIRRFDVYLVLKVKNEENEIKIKNILKEVDDIFRFMVGGYEPRISIGSFDFRNPVDEVFISLTIGDDKISYKKGLGEGHTFDNKLRIRKDTVLNREKGHYKFFDLAIKEDRTEIEKRIINALNWLGQASNSIDILNNLVFCTIALESMLNIDKANFSASIVNQISEGAALITAVNLSDRKKVKKDIKRIYSKRSKIAHGNYQTTVTVEEVVFIYNIVKYILEDLMYNDEYIKIKKIQQLQEILEEKKLS